MTAPVVPREASESGLLSPSEIAPALGVSAMTVRRWVERGELDAIRLGGGQRARYRISRVALARFLRRADEPTSPSTRRT